MIYIWMVQNNPLHMVVKVKQTLTSFDKVSFGRGYQSEVCIDGKMGPLHFYNQQLTDLMYYKTLTFKEVDLEYNYGHFITDSPPIVTEKLVFCIDQ